MSELGFLILGIMIGGTLGALAMAMLAAGASVDPAWKDQP